MVKGVDWPLPPSNDIPLSWKITSRITISIVGIFSKIWAEYLNTAVVDNLKVWEDAVEKRDGQPLITVSNHESCMDDPVVLGVLNWRIVLMNSSTLRWSPAAHDICFTNKFFGSIFARGKVIPIVRGNGVYQQCMNFCVERLNQGEWVHIFPEGKINMTKEPMRIKWGVGRLIADCNRVPIVVPMWHIGMDTLLPNRYPYIPRIGKTFTLCIGNPIDFTGQLNSLRESKKSPMEIRKVLTDRIQEELFKLKEKAEQMHNSYRKGAS